MNPAPEKLVADLGEERLRSTGTLRIRVAVHHRKRPSAHSGPGHRDIITGIAPRSCSLSSISRIAESSGFSTPKRHRDHIDVEPTTTAQVTGSALRAMATPCRKGRRAIRDDPANTGLYPSLQKGDR